MSFDHLGLSDELLKAVSDAGYEKPTDIQASAIPSILMGRDILGIAQTGTGKTASFTLPMLDILGEGRARARMPRSLILEPTRELAAQVAESFEKYGKNHKLSMALLIGGVNFANQEKLLDRGVDVLIATPGRLLDHFSRGKLLMTGIDILVVDEADRMLDMGFIPDVEKICECIPGRHQTLFFSATMPPPIKKLTDQFLDDPKFIQVARAASTADTVAQHLITVDRRQKRAALRTLLEGKEVRNGIIFCNRKVEVKEVHASLKRHKFNVGQLHGDMVQSERMEVLQGFKDGTIQFLCASDVAARGLDVPNVSHVFNFDVPSHAEDYVHRIGRTGRAGKEGTAITLTTEGRDDTKYVAAIEHMTGEKIPRTVIEGIGKVVSKAPAKKVKPVPSKSKATDHKRNVTDKKPVNDGKKAQSLPAKDEKQDRKPPRDKNPRSKAKGRRTKNDDTVQIKELPNKPVVGLGHHVPAFLKSAVKIKR